VGKASVVTPPAVTVVLAVALFGEKLNWTKVAAIVLAIAAGAALGYEGSPKGAAEPIGEIRSP
jgi:drug/metabolite transporter (DMT)-like permease